ncbi:MULTISPECIES: major coat protein [Providencia]|uniref:major coat protein n=1 Tax=Providencia TaxID=586 RepID=UPI002349DE1E|nr:MULTISPECIES: major coat protein [unclassified Providencia]HEM8209823.1 capsid protein [Providencia rettgeri]HEP0304913.1 capsid protein [Providencia rettgeri]
MFKKTLATIIVATASIASPAVFAAETPTSTVPQAAQDAITGVGNTATGMIDLAWPVIALVVGGFLAIKMFKKVASKV